MSNITNQINEGKITLTTDRRHAIQFATRKEATAAAKAIGWQAKDVTPIETMGFKVWSIWDNHCRYMTRTGYAYAAHLHGLDYGWKPPVVTEKDIAEALSQSMEEPYPSTFVGPVGPIHSR